MGEGSVAEDDQLAMRVVGTGSLDDFLGDAVAYRTLEPLDRGLPGLSVLRQPLGISPDRVPRKVEPAYGRVVAEILREAGRSFWGSAEFSSAIVLGDTEHNDGGAFVNICDAIGCPGGAFICDETALEERMTTTDRDAGRTLHVANRWRLIDDFEEALARRGLLIGERTVVIIDIDKTALGARGRNHRPIDEARGAAMLRTARELRGDAVDIDLLMAAYDHFNHPQYHAFTTDNQDFIAYLALLVEAGWSSRRDLEEGITGGRLDSFADLLDSVSASTDALPPGVRQAHDEVVAAVAAGDPTPFKDFRRAEYRETVDRMTPGEETTDVARLLETRLTLTAEVWRKAGIWRDRGALLFGLSDKPDEASCPTPELEVEGYRPLHRTAALVVGED